MTSRPLVCALVSALGGMCLAAPALGAPQLAGATLPTARSGLVGQPLTVLGVVVNAGDEAGVNCRPSLATPFAGTFVYRAVASDNVTFTAPQDTPVGTPAGGAQNFVLGFTASAALEEAEIGVAFACDNAAASPVIKGVNVVEITAESTQGPDIIPILVTPTSDGVIRIPALGATEFAAAAAINIGAGASGPGAPVIVSVDLGEGVGAPISLTLCETDAGGQCVNAQGDPQPTPPPPGQTSLATAIGGTARFFAVFAAADQGAGVAFLPDLARVRLRFFDDESGGNAPVEGDVSGAQSRPAGAGVERAATSAAITAAGRDFSPGETIPAGIYEAAAETGDGTRRGGGVIVVDVDGAVASAFDLPTGAAPLSGDQALFFGDADADAAAGEVAFAGLRYDAGAAGQSQSATGDWAPQAGLNAVLLADPPAGGGFGGVAARSLYSALSLRGVDGADLGGSYEIVRGDRQVGAAVVAPSASQQSPHEGTLSGAIIDGDTRSASNCELAGTYAQRRTPAAVNIFALTATLATRAGEPVCALAGAYTGLGFQYDDLDSPDAVALLLERNDAGAALRLNLVLPAPGAGEVRMQRLSTGFSQPLGIAAIPDGTGRVIIVQKGGLARILNPATGTIAAQPFLDVSAEVSTDSERGLLGLALAPDFVATGTFYVNLTNTAGDTEIRRYQTMAGDRDRADPSSMDIILTQTQPFANHNGGWLGFGPGGHLYIALGDGGSGGDPQNFAQNLNSLLGKMLRIDPSGDDFPADPTRDYAIPPGNPFAQGGGAAEIWALGLRNPFQASVDPVTGLIFIGDVGQNAIEEIDLMAPDDGGANFGWNRREGTQAYNGGLDSPGFTLPVAEYSHGTDPDDGNSVTGGLVYRGPINALRGQYIFADFVRPRIWSLAQAGLVIGQTVPSSQFTNRYAQFTPNAGTIANITALGTDQAGNLYVVTIGGSVYRLNPAPN